VCRLYVVHKNILVNDLPCIQSGKKHSIHCVLLTCVIRSLFCQKKKSKLGRIVSIDMTDKIVTSAILFFLIVPTYCSFNRILKLLYRELCLCVCVIFNWELDTVHVVSCCCPQAVPLLLNKKSFDSSLLE
jgi:hypothetical protein